MAYIRPCVHNLGVIRRPVRKNLPFKFNNIFCSFPVMIKAIKLAFHGTCFDT